MRKLVWFTLGFAAACAVGAYLVSGLWLMVFAAVLLVISLYAAAIFRKNRKPLVLTLLGCVLGLIWTWGIDTVYLRQAKDHNDCLVNATITVTDYSEPTDYGICADGRITLKDRTYRIRLYTYEPESLAPGDRIAGAVNLRYTNSGEWSGYYSGAGIYLIGYMDEEVSVARAEKVPIRYFPALLQKKLTELLDQTFPQDTLAFARALLLGDTSLLDYETDTALSVSGIRHIVAVSGLHISILFSLVYGAVGRRRGLLALIGLPVLGLLAAVAGFSPSVTRACVMQALMILAMLVDREYDAPSALAAAVLIMLVINPMTVSSVSFQLSVGCVVGILLFSQKIQNAILGSCTSGIARWAAGTVSITLSTMIVTTPLCAIYFGAVSLIGVLTNLLTLWLVSVLLLGIVAVCLMGAVWLPAGKAIAWLLSWPIRYVLGVAKLFSGFPLAAVYTQSIYIVLWIVFCYVLLAVFYVSKDKKGWLLFTAMAVGLAASLIASWAEPRQDRYRMTVLDVGQGQCILLKTGEDHYVIDCGGDHDEGTADLAAQTLLSQGIRQIDGLILTHYDGDHAGGAEYFLSRIDAQRLYLPNLSDDGSVKTDLTAAYREKITWIQPERTLTLAEGKLTLFAGSGEKTDNESGLCILFQQENCDILITGDRSTAGEAALLEQTELPDLEILIAGHHGSAYATGRELLLATLPEIVVISVGANNSYGHPAQALLERLSLFECQILRTDQNGNITIRG